MKFLSSISILLLASCASIFSQNIIDNGDFESGTLELCHCPTGYDCTNDAGRVVDGVHPAFAFINEGCSTDSTAFVNLLGAYNGSGYLFFYASWDSIQTINLEPILGTIEIEMCVWYAGPQIQSPASQDGTDSYFTFLIDGNDAGPRVAVPAYTEWTQHCFTTTISPGYHRFGIRSGNLADYAIWLDDFTVCPLEFDQMDIYLGNDTTLCEGETLNLNIAINDANYLWQDSSMLQTFEVTEEGTYWVEINTGCQIIYDSIHVSYDAQPFAILGDDTSICEGQSFYLDISNNSANSNYVWDNGAFNSTRLIENPGLYWVKVENDCGVAIDTIVIDKEEDNCVCSVFLPSAFTPNNDGINDQFTAIANCNLFNYQMKIYNRWGEELFQSESINDSWDGTFNQKEIETDVYSYNLTFSYATGEFGQESGHVTLLR